MSKALDKALGSVPIGLRAPLIEQFDEMLSDYRSGRWESVGLKAGKICEIIYSIISGYISGQYPAGPSKPKNMVAACQALEKSPGAALSRSVRIQIPRLLIAIYELRNNRAIGHVGGEVDPNHMDAELFLRSCKWLLAELIRVFDASNVAEAAALVEGVTERVIPLVWEQDGIKKVLNPKMSAKDKALVLSYATPGGSSAKDLASWVGYGNLSRFRNDVISALHKEALVHYDKESDQITISPTGIRKVEANNLLALA